MKEPLKMDMVERVARLGDELTQATMAKYCAVDNKWVWAEKAARQGERDGFYELGTCYMYAYGCTKDERTTRSKIFGTKFIFPSKSHPGWTPVL
jgi:hypothetical protein